MKEKSVHITMWMLIIAGGVFFTLSFIEFRAYQSQEQQANLLQENERAAIPFNLNEVAENLSSYSSGLDLGNYLSGSSSYVALFILNP